MGKYGNIFKYLILELELPVCHFQKVQVSTVFDPNYCTVCLGFLQLLGKLVVKYISTYAKGTLKKDHRRTYLMIFFFAMFFCAFLILIFPIKHMLWVLI